MAKKKKKPNIASIMADHDKMFRSLAPGAFGKVPPVFKQSEKEMQRAKKPKRQKRRDQKRAASAQPETSVIDVLSSGVVDAISGATFGLETMFGGYLQQIGMATSQVDRQDNSPSEAAKQDASQDTSSGIKAQADRSGDKPQVDSKPTEDTGSDLKTSEADPDLQEFDISGEEELQTTGVGEPLDQPDVAGEVQRSVDASVQQDVDATSKSVQAGVSQGVTESVASLETSRSQDFGKEMDEVSGRSESGSKNPRVAKRREAAKKEREAAARNFRRQRGENVPPPPIAGIPNPAPMSDSFELANTNQNGSPYGSTEDSKSSAMNAAATNAETYADKIVDVIEDLARVLQTLTTRLSKVEQILEKI